MTNQEFTAEDAEIAERGIGAQGPQCPWSIASLRALCDLRGEILLALIALAGAGLASGCASSKPDATPAPTVVAPARAETPVISVEPWTYAERPGQKIRTRHFQIYTTEMSPLIVGRVPAFVETALAHYRGSLAEAGSMLPAPPQGTLDTYILDNRSSWERLTRQLLGPSAAPYLEIDRGGYAFGSRAILFDIGAASTLAVAAHEGWHQYTQATFAQPLPVWLEEGVATYMEGHRWTGPLTEAGASAVFLPWANTERFDQLRTAAGRAELLPLQMLLDEAPQTLIGRADDSALTYYAQLWALMHFLAEADNGKYRSQLERVLSDAANGNLTDRLTKSLGPRAAQAAVLSRRGSPVFFTYFGDPKALEAPYRAFVNRIVAVGSRGPILQGESPIKGN